MIKWIKEHPLYALAVSGILILGADVFFYWLKFHGREFGEPEEWGQFGDFVGGTTNPILAFLTFVGVLYTIYLNKTELNYMAKEREDRLLSERRDETYKLIELSFSQINKAFENMKFYIPNRLPNPFQSVEAYLSEKGNEANTYNFIKNTKNEKVCVHLSRLVVSLEKYCRLYEQYGGSEDATYFYKLHFFELICFLDHIKHISPTTHQYFQSFLDINGKVDITVPKSSVEVQAGFS